jgi:hypothetical protein
LVAPVNSAFAKLPAETVTFLSSAEGKENLTELLLYHFLRGVVYFLLTNFGAKALFLTLLKVVPSRSLLIAVTTQYFSTMPMFLVGIISSPTTV